MLGRSVVVDQTRRVPRWMVFAMFPTQSLIGFFFQSLILQLLRLLLKPLLFPTNAELVANFRLLGRQGCHGELISFGLS